MQPAVSLVTTVYNRDRYLADTIESVLTQNYQDFELLIWDDGSTDDSVEIAQYYAAQDQRIRVISAPHRGRGSAVKSAVAETTGTYVGLVDSDDLLAQTALAETVAALEQHPETGLVYTDYIVIDENSQVKEYGVRCKTPYSKEHLLVDFMVFHFRLIRRSIYDQVGGFNELFECSQDYELCLRLSEVTDFLQIRRPLYYYRYHRNSISGQKRIEQIYWSTEAIKQALQRRGMNDYELEVQIYAHFGLFKRQTIASTTLCA